MVPNPRSLAGRHTTSPLAEVALGLAASLFFAVTFVLNRAMDLGGGSWLWSASLRYLFMAPLLYLLVPGEERKVLFADILGAPGTWLLWSTVGFGLFYAPLCLAATLGPSWFVAGAWQLTIVAGALLSPLFFEAPTGGGAVNRARRRVPHRILALSSLILVGVLLLQLSRAGEARLGELLAGCLWIAVAAFAWPLGNRKMMEKAAPGIAAGGRALGMTLCSLPFWLLLAGIALGTAGAPRPAQGLQCLIVALSSGVVATLLFFKATDLAKGDSTRLAIVESTQAGEVLFALLGGLLLLGDRAPDLLGILGLALIVLGMVANALSSRRALRG